MDLLDKELILFGGKGGVGKTTCAAATALYLARTNPDKKILVFSTDPAHSLRDSFDCEIGSEVTPIDGFGNLFGLEIDVHRVQEEFKFQHEVDMFVLASRVPYLDREMVSDFFNFSLPGMDELWAVLKIIDLLKAREYDLVILDTAPTGHTLRLLELPDLMCDMINVTEESQEMYRFGTSRFSRKRYVKDEADRFLDSLRADIEGLKSILTDPKATEFVPITIPEAMGIYETEDLLTALNRYNISVTYIVINGVNPETECDFCISRKKEQERYIEEINRKFSEYSIIKMPLFPHEIRGKKELGRFAEIFFGKPYEYKPTYVKPSRSYKVTKKVTKSNIENILQNKLQLILFGGKGGVGKTTCAAATALHLARTNPDKKILIFSTDPAHSLSDSFDREIGSEVTPIHGFDNLSGVEINPAEVFNEFKKPYLKEVNAMIDIIEEEGADLSFERRLASDFFSLSPPGLDELMAGARIMDFMENNEYHVIILDTAPTGHTLRLLELPEIVIQWFDKLIRYISEYTARERVRNNIEEIMRLLVETRKKLLNTQKMLNNAEKTGFVAVTIPEAMGVLETERLIASIRSLRIPSKYIIINKVIPSVPCSFCASKRKEQKKYIREIRGLFTEMDIAELPLLPGEVKGMDALSNFAEVMYGG